LDFTNRLTPDAQKRISSAVEDARSARRVLVGNGLLTAVSLFACAFLSPGTPRTLIVAVLFFGGLCSSMQFTALDTLGFADVPPDQMNPAPKLPV
jgi:hypothetical protein